MATTTDRLAAIEAALGIVSTHTQSTPAIPRGMTQALRDAERRLDRAARNVVRCQAALNSALEDMATAISIVSGIHNELDPARLRGTDATERPRKRAART